MGRSKKILVTGAGGLLGSEFCSMALAENKEFATFPKNHKELDITHLPQIEENLSRIKPDFLINCGAYTQVDRAESEPELARKVNVLGPQKLAEACLRHQTKLIHYSTDFVFDGQKRSPYIESDPLAPLNIYGKTKLEGEQVIRSILPKDQHLILRISWPYGRNGKNFIHTLLELSKTRSEIKVVTDQVGVPNPANLLAQKTLCLMEETSGLFHLSCTGSCSRYELIRFLLERVRSACHMIPISSDQFTSLAKRPCYSVLGSEREEVIRKAAMPHWQEALMEYLKDLAWNYS